MQSEIYNANPIVFNTTKRNKTQKCPKVSLWVDDDEDSDNERDVVEGIDSEEVFGSTWLLRSAEHVVTF